MDQGLALVVTDRHWQVALALPPERPCVVGTGAGADAELPEGCAIEGLRVRPVVGGVELTVPRAGLFRGSDGRPRRSDRATLTCSGVLWIGDVSLTLTAADRCEARSAAPMPAGWRSTIVDSQRLAALTPGLPGLSGVVGTLFDLSSLAACDAGPEDVLLRGLDVIQRAVPFARGAVFFAEGRLRHLARFTDGSGHDIGTLAESPLVREVLRDGVARASGRGAAGPHACVPLRPAGDALPRAALVLERAPGAAAFSSMDLELTALLGRCVAALVDRAETRRSLQRTSAQLAAVLDALPTAVAVVHGDGEVEAVNRAARGLLGDGVDGGATTVLRSGSIAALVEEAFRAGERRSADRRSGGRVLRVDVVPATGGPGLTDVAVIGLRDVTEERAQEEQARLAERLRFLGESLAVFAHEVNNPLTSVVGFAALLEQRAPAHLRETCARIGQQAERCLALTRDVLSFARARPAPHAPFDLRALIQRTVLLLQTEVERGGATLTVDAPPLHVLGGELQVQQVLVNLIRNAAQALERAAARRAITVRAESRDARVVVEVADTGPGIDPRVRDRLFAPFATSRAEGSGLGLCVSRRIIEEHGGTLTCESAPGDTRFRFDLPHVAPLDRRVGSRRQRRLPATRRFLVLDDEEAIGSLLEEALTAQGHEVSTATSFEHALQLVERHGPFDVFILDLRVPGGGAAELLEALRAGGHQPPRRCVLMTGEVDDAVRQVADRFDAALILKPFRLEEVVEATEVPA